MSKPCRNINIVMNEKECVTYEIPRIEVIEVEVEKGFAVSPSGTGEDMIWG